jgi:hypothetical protein
MIVLQVVWSCDCLAETGLSCIQRHRVQDCVPGLSGRAGAGLSCRIVLRNCPGRVAGLSGRIVEAVRPEEDCLAELSWSWVRIVWSCSIVLQDCPGRGSGLILRLLS